MNFNVRYFVGQVEDGMVSFQTHPKGMCTLFHSCRLSLLTLCSLEGSYSSRSTSFQSQNTSSPSQLKGIKSYTTPTVKRTVAKPSFPRTIPSVRAYGYDDPGACCLNYYLLHHSSSL
jgi:hypothetical protein